ncbi:hypothetical protein GXW82_43430 [Streptacidiphilus sp. 4-A2]|nr:hypothetical protein [Streptacidiphilus sp. 4-A2]MBC3844533.1 hypothetical protein [Streptacidiphilus sp. 4-A2]
MNFYTADADGTITEVGRGAEPDWSTFGDLEPVRSTMTLCTCEGSVPWDE